MRSYLSQLSVSSVLGTPVVTGNVFFWANQHGSGQDYTIVWNPDFFVWSSHRWPLDEVIVDCYYQQPAGSAHNPVDFNLNYIPVASNNLPSLLWIPFGSLTTPLHFPLPAVAQPYWWNGDDDPISPL
jgi:hypothetical protein